jgi:hypothetical protein
MAITFASGVITISGEATTPVGLWNASQAGGWGAVTRVGLSKYWYDMAATRVVVASGGTLTCDEDGSLVFGSWADWAVALTVNSGGTLVIGTSATRGRCLDFTKALSLETDTRSNYHEDWAAIRINSNGLLTWNGGEVQAHFPIAFMEGSIVRIASVNCKLYNEGAQTRVGGGLCQIRQRATNVEISGWSSYAYILTLIGNASQFENYIVSTIPSGSRALAPSGDSPSNTWMIFKGADFSDNIDQHITLFAGKWVRAINTWDGSNLVCATYAAASSQNFGLIEVRQEIAFTLPSGSGAKVYTKDTNNGLRLAANQVGTNPDYVADRAYTLTESAGAASYTTDGGVLIGVFYNKDGGVATVGDKFDSRGIANDKTDIFTWLKVEYGQQPATSNIIMKGTSAVTAEIQSLPDLGVTEADKAVVAAYTGITPVYAGGTLTVTVTQDHTWNEVYDFIKWWESENPASVWANGKASFVSTANKLDYAFTNLALVVNGARLECGAGQVLPSKPALAAGGFFEDAGGALWEAGGDLHYAARAYIQVKDAITAADIEGAVVGFGDGATQARLLYNTALAEDTLVTDADGKADGYFVYRIGAVTYADTKMVVGEYAYNFAIVPRTLTGAPIGSAAGPEVTRLSADAQVTKTKADAALVAGITVDVPTDTIDLADNTLADAYDNLKYQVTADADIDAGVPGCMYAFLYGLPLTKSGTTYTGRSATTVYQNLVIGSDTFAGGIVEWDTPGDYSGAFQSVDFRFTAAGTYDFRTGSSFTGTTNIHNASGGAVTVRLPLGTSYTTSGSPTPTVDTSVAITIANANLIDGSRVQLYNITQDTELENTIVTGGAGYSYTATMAPGAQVEDGDVLRLRATWADGAAYKENYEESAQASVSGITFLGAQVDWAAANGLSRDGADYTSVFTADYPNVQVDVDASSNLFNMGDLVAWLCYIQTTENGIKQFFGAISGQNAANWIINTSVVNLFLDNVNAETATQGDSVILMRDDEVYPQAVPTSGGGGIGMIQSGLVFTTIVTTSDAEVVDAAEVVQAVWEHTATTAAGTKGDTLTKARLAADTAAALSA